MWEVVMNFGLHQISNIVAGGVYVCIATVFLQGKCKRNGVP
jgi:hypothetical protein